MSEILKTSGYKIDDYQRDVVATRRAGHPEEWEAGYYALISDEWAELVSQHGNTMSLFLPGTDRHKELKANPNMLEGIKEELGDLLWFDVSAVALLGLDAKAVCAEALRVHTGQRLHFETLADLQEAVHSNAHKIEVLTKWGIYQPESPRATRFTSLFGSPFYHFNRTTMRLTRALTNGQYDVAPFTASQMEPLSDLDGALGNHINTLSYLAYLSDLSLDEIAKFNIEKNQHRKVSGYSK